MRPRAERAGGWHYLSAGVLLGALLRAEGRQPLARQPPPLGWLHPPTRPTCHPPRDVADNRLGGPLPAGWARGMDSLRAVNATNNAIAGALPGQWSNLTGLQAL
jgi:hypothetical protein